MCTYVFCALRNVINHKWSSNERYQIFTYHTMTWGFWIKPQHRVTYTNADNLSMNYIGTYKCKFINLAKISLLKIFFNEIRYIIKMGECGIVGSSS